MRRNRASVIRREIERAAFQAVEGAAFASAGPAAPADMALAGQDDGTGTWVPYGRLDVTPLADFRLS